MPLAVQLRTVVQCPLCGFKTVEQMSVVEKRPAFICPACEKTSVVTAQQCCIFCAWGRTSCPQQQALT